jgi:hypothetical protein
MRPCIMRFLGLVSKTCRRVSTIDLSTGLMELLFGEEGA